MTKLLLMSKMQKTKDGRSFRKFFTSMDIIVAGEEEKGDQEKTLAVRFDKNVNTNAFNRGILVCKDDDVEVPFKWAIRKVIDKKSGQEKDSYPYVYIKAVESYTPKKPKSTGRFNLKNEDTDEEQEQDLPFEE